MSLLHTILESIFPQRVTYQQVRDATLTEVLAHYQPGCYQDIHFLAPFQAVIIRASVHEVKYHKNDQAAALLAVLLEAGLRDHQIDVLVPVPLSLKRHRTRGYNQVALILRAVSQQSTYRIQTNLLYRVRDTPSQTALSRSQRQANMQQAFAVPAQAGSLIVGKHIVLVDDVVTTGATLNAAKAALLPHHPASITCIAIAH